MSEEKHHSGEHHKRKSGAITLTKEGLWKGISVILGVLLVISIWTGGFGLGSDTVQVQDEQLKAEDIKLREEVIPTPTPTVDMKALIDDDDVLGDADAPVTIVEFSDFECPFCGRYFDQTAGKIKEEYVDTGKVKLVFRDFPLSFHASAQKAAEAAECAGEQGKYWEMHDILFENRNDLGIDKLKEYAADLELDTDAFDSCLDNGDMADEVAKDMRDGQAAGVTGTPAFIINGQLVKGAQPFEKFKEIIDAELAK